ncbi:MAG: GHKL domain-containing protein [Flavobacteriales bacterium]|nr:MAG: GHKL domain-containing protein [Flavobacteriales bacterium]
MPQPLPPARSTISAVGYCVLTLLLLGAAWLSRGPSPDDRLASIATDLEQRLAQRAELLRTRATTWHRTAQSDGLSALRGRMQELHAEQENLGIGHWAWQADTLALWTSTGAISEDTLRRTFRAHLRTGSNILLHTFESQQPAWHATAEVYTAPPVSNRYLSASFHPSLGVPRGVIAETTPGIGPVVRDAEGHVMFRLSWNTERLPFNTWDIARALLLILASITLLAAVWKASMHIARRNAALGILVFIVVLVLLRWISMRIYPVEPFDRLQLFGPQLYATSQWLPSLGDLLITGILLTILARFIHASCRPIKVEGPRAALATGLLATALLLALARCITVLAIGLVEDSSIDLDLYHLDRVDVHSAIGLLCVALLFTAWILLADATTRALSNVGRTRHALFTSALVVLGSLIVHHISGVYDLLLVLWPLPLLIIIVLGRRRAYRFGHAVIALITLSAISAHLLIKFTQHREQQERILIAERLITDQDPVVEQLFRSTAPRLRNDSAIYALLTDTLLCRPNELDARVRQEFFTGYWERYRVHLYAFTTDGRLVCSNTNEAARSLATDNAPFTPALPVADMPELHFHTESGQQRFYHAQVAIMATDTSPPTQLLIELLPRAMSDVQGYPELLLSGERTTEQRAARYAFARYDQGLLTEQRGAEHPFRWSGEVSPTGAWSVRDEGSSLALGDATGSMVVLSLPLPTLLDKASTFSWLFAFFSVLLVGAFVVRTVQRDGGLPAFSLGGKVRVALLAFSVVVLLFFGLGAQRLLSGITTQRNDSALQEKARSVAVELQHKLGEEQLLSTQNAPYISRLLDKFGNVFFTDINIYAPQGTLIAATRPQMFTAGLLSERMHPVAFASLAGGARNAVVQVEHIGSAAYRSAYLPLRNNSGTLLGFVNLPSFARQGELEAERTGLITAIVNLFVLLLALSLLAGVLISNWTTRPLEVLRRSIEGMALRGTNERITYTGRDEIGELVRVYNTKVQELHESAEKLARSERESAWKEMARQVAHEIKNPLTPMKLGIQHFQRTWDPSAPEARQRLDRFATGMVEQIDALSRVAGDFSRFAQMGAANETILDLNDVARNAVALFSDGADAAVSLRTAELLVVKADREHLLRVFNNLITNALQAVPEGMQGRVDVVLRRDGDHAVAEVRDNGSGVPEEIRDRIFEPNFTTKSSGMGLGLAMVKRMVEQAGGEVWYESVEGQGAQFVVRLPLAR